MNHQPGWLVDDHQRLVFVDDVEGNVFGVDGAVETWAIEHQGDDIARLDPIVALHCPSIGVNTSGIGRSLNAIA